MFVSINEYRKSINETITNSQDLLTAYQSYGFELDRNTGGIVKDLSNDFYIIIRYADPMEEINDTTLVVCNDDIEKYIVLTGDDNIKTFLDNGFNDFENAIINDPNKADQIAQQFGFVNEIMVNETNQTLNGHIGEFDWNEINNITAKLHVIGLNDVKFYYGNTDNFHYLYPEWNFIINNEKYKLVTQDKDLINGEFVIRKYINGFSKGYVVNGSLNDCITYLTSIINELHNEAVNPVDYMGRDQAIEIANSLGFAFDISSKYHSHYVWTENINSSVISSIEYRLYKVSGIRWKISSRITYALINSENVSEVNTISDVCWFDI